MTKPPKRRLRAVLAMAPPIPPKTMESEMQQEVKELTPKSVKVQPLTQALADQISSIPRLHNERPLEDSHVAWLRREAENRQLVTFDWAIAKLGETVYRVNGQHSSTMLSQLYKDADQDMRAYLDRQQVSLSEYAIRNTSELTALFRKFDAAKSARSNKQVAGIYQNSVEALRDIRSESAKRGVDAIAWYKKRVEEKTLTQDENYQIFYDPTIQPFLRWINELPWKKMEELKKLPVIAAMYATFLVSDGDAKRFWKDVPLSGDNEDLPEENPRKKLDLWLQDLNQVKKTAKPLEIFQGCISAWNASRENKSLREIKYDTKKGLHDIL